MAIFATCVNEKPLPARTAIAILESVRWSRVNSRPSGLHYETGFVGFALPLGRILGRKILALAVRPLVNLPKHLAGAIPTFPYAGPIFQEPDWKKENRRNVKLSRARFGFWPLLAAKIEF